MSPDAVVDVNGLPLGRIETLPGGSVRIGAMVRNSELANHDAIKRRYPALSEALLSGASPQIRNMATVGGNLMQRTRCYYFRDVASPCNKRSPGSGCAAVGGFNRIHAVLGTSERCIAAHPGDMPVALAAFDAMVRTRRADGRQRTIPLQDFHVAYGEDPARESVLEHGELIEAVELPAVPWFARSVYLKVRDRASYEFALASAAVALDVAGGTIRAARVALGGVATKPWRSAAAERALTGAKPGAAAWKAAAAAALEGARPQRHNAFKIELAQRTVARALAMAAARTV
jgi:xanthine dehydrogenase YagS FAD-binding subunit